MPDNKSDTDASKAAEKELHAMIVTEIPPLGFGNAEADISLTKKLENNQFNEEVIDKTAEIIMTGEVMKPVDNQDDGCIDGRLAEAVVVIDGVEEKVSPAENANHERAKVAGGGYITALAMYIGAKGGNTTIDQDMAASAHLLTEQGVYSGAHTADTHGNIDGTGCGANDGFLKNIKDLGFRVELATKSLIEVAGLNFDETILDGVLDKWKAAANSQPYLKASTGQTRLGIIKSAIADAQVASGKEKPVAVSKDLKGGHNEAFIVVNYVDGYTLSQTKLHQKITNEYRGLTDSAIPQAFVVDVWRIKQLADALAAGDEAIDATRALYAGVAFQVATAAALTDGSLRMMTVN